MSPSNFNEDLRASILDWLWRGWSSLGVAGAGSANARTDHVIDVEVLLLATTVWGRRDPRLFDEALDWLCLHGSLVHMQRLKNLHKQSGLGDAPVLGAMADVAQQQSSQVKWKALAAPTRPKGTLEALFVGGSGLTRVNDPVFARHGFQRGRLELRQMSLAPSPAIAANLWLKLRCLFGTSTRAEIMLHLLTSGPMTAARMARLSGFTQRSVLLPLREMALSGHVIEPPSPPRERVFPGKTPAKRHRGPSLAYSVRAEEWSFLRTWNDPADFPKHVPVTALLAACQSLDGVTEEGDQETLAIRCREAVKKHRVQLHQQGWSDELGLQQRMTGTQWLDHIAEKLPLLFQSL
ncbi:MAG: hypothetical protein IPK22_02115 [Verrucomicrobiaceae bacterium]|nr:hypothetical protein [Verrucomicrobiaceae bacterium]